MQPLCQRPIRIFDIPLTDHISWFGPARFLHVLGPRTPYERGGAGRSTVRNFISHDAHLVHTWPPRAGVHICKDDLHSMKGEAGWRRQIGIMPSNIPYGALLASCIS